ncbi:hypothetical protein BD31_I0375 [Candidatus Nitrosopumilus salaria BD31]|uniref:Uncharacterized protein n=1 Tax=Candidatus Nitrosopumilus salarius BD31 TaxID=859350 RepID=I3D3H5_9ARCH|nr:hypothetical protein [Candidatus Nitrosopumilus salaria]EIJ66268.1 hypothetical protein BD31_I0375 [Candidatus Nitrosopumilus salaria BD31]
MRTRLCEKCGAVMERLDVDSPTNMIGFRCPNRKDHPSTELE